MKMPVGGGRQHKNEEGGGRSYPCVPLLLIVILSGRKVFSDNKLNVLD